MFGLVVQLKSAFDDELAAAAVAAAKLRNLDDSFIVRLVIKEKTKSEKEYIVFK